MVDQGRKLVEEAGLLYEPIFQAHATAAHNTEPREAGLEADHAEAEYSGPSCPSGFEKILQLDGPTNWTQGETRHTQSGQVIESLVEKIDQEQGGKSGEDFEEYVLQTPKLGYGSDLLSDDIEDATPWEDNLVDARIT